MGDILNSNNYIGYNGYYDLCTRSLEKREKIPKSISVGIMNGVIAQFLADLFFSLFFNDESILENDIEISPATQYYAAVAAGAIGGYGSLYLDRFAIVALTNTTYVFVNNYISSMLNETEFDLSTEDLIFDIIATVVILLLFDKKATNDFINHYNEKHGIMTRPLDTKKTAGEAVFISIITNAFFEFKRGFVAATGNAGAVSVGVDIDSD